MQAEDLEETEADFVDSGHDSEEEDERKPGELLDADEERRKAKKKNARAKSKCLQCKEVNRQTNVKIDRKNQNLTHTSALEGQSLS